METRVGREKRKSWSSSKRINKCVAGGKIEQRKESEREPSKFQLKIQIFGLRSFKRSLLPFLSVVQNSRSLDRV